MVALADKLETLVGLFGIGQLPTGDKDPFALRRHALGVMRMLVERDLRLPCRLVGCEPRFGALRAAARRRCAATDLQAFMLDRLGGYLREHGYSAQEVDAVLSTAPADAGRGAAAHWPPCARSPRCPRRRRWPPPTSASATS